MTRRELIDRLNSLQLSNDPEAAHADADQALLEYIDIDEVTEAYDKIDKWYA